MLDIFAMFDMGGTLRYKVNLPSPLKLGKTSSIKKISLRKINILNDINSNIIKYIFLLYKCLTSFSKVN